MMEQLKRPNWNHFLFIVLLVSLVGGWMARDLFGFRFLKLFFSSVYWSLCIACGANFWLNYAVADFIFSKPVHRNAWFAVFFLWHFKSSLKMCLKCEKWRGVRLCHHQLAASLLKSGLVGRLVSLGGVFSFNIMTINGEIQHLMLMSVKTICLRSYPLDKEQNLRWLFSN